MPKKKRPAQSVQEAAVGTDDGAIQPMKTDVLFGRGDSINRHPGNKKFRELVDSHKRVYLASRFKQEKRMIADSIIASVGNLNPPGRFLAKDPSTGAWQLVGDARAREKTLQALREKARAVRTQEQARPAPQPALPPASVPPVGVAPAALPQASMPPSALPQLGVQQQSLGLYQVQPNIHLAPSALLGIHAFQPHPALASYPGSIHMVNPFASLPVDPSFPTLAIGTGLPPGQPTPAQSPAAVAPQHQPGVLPASLPPNPNYNMGLYPPAPAPVQALAPASGDSNPTASGLATGLNLDGGASAGGERLRPRSASASSEFPIPLGPPPVLPSAGSTRQRVKLPVLQGISSRLLSDEEKESLAQKPASRRATHRSTADMSQKPASLQPSQPSMLASTRPESLGPPQAHSTGSSTRPASLQPPQTSTVDMSLTPRAQVQSQKDTASPVSAGTFDALQRVAFPSPRLDLLFSAGALSPNHAFSPRRLPPPTNTGLHAAAAIPASILRQLDPLSALSPRGDSSQPPTPGTVAGGALPIGVQPPTYLGQEHIQPSSSHTRIAQPPTPFREGQPPTARDIEALSHLSQEQPGLHAQQHIAQPPTPSVTRQYIAGSATQALGYLGLAQQPQSSGYSPLRTNTVAGQGEAGTLTPSSLPANFFSPPSTLQHLGYAQAPSPASEPTATRTTGYPRGIPLPRAHLAPRLHRENRGDEDGDTSKQSSEHSDSQR